MNDSGFDADIAERMLRGETTGPPELAKLLAAASSGLAVQDPTGEEAAVAAFRETRPHQAGRPRRRRLAAMAGLKTALIGFLIVLAGGITVAAASQHLPGPLGNKHPHSTRTPTTPRTGTTLIPHRAPSHLTPDDEHHKQSRGNGQGEHPHKPKHPKRHSHSAKGPKVQIPEIPSHDPIAPTKGPSIPGTGSLKGGGRTLKSIRRPHVDLGPAALTP